MKNRIQFMEDNSDEEFLKFENVKSPLHNRPDIHGMLLLSQLDPENTRDMVSAAEHDQIWFDADPDLIFSKATDEQLLDLLRSGINYDDTYTGFYSFV